MDIQTLEKSVKKMIGTLYMSRFPSKGVVIDIPNFDEKMSRLRSLQRKIQNHASYLSHRNKVNTGIASAIADLTTAAQKMSAGETFMAFDVERTMQNVTKEIGVTMWQGGQYRSFNYRIAGAKMKVGFQFGDTTIVTAEELGAIMVEHGRVADNYVGHSLTVDFDHLKSKGIVIPRCPVFDTFWLSRVATAEIGESGNRSLSELCSHFGIQADRPHSGGNDARYNMELLVAMTEGL